MQIRRTLNLIGKIKEYMNQFIIDELKKIGIEGIVPSHGEILRILFLTKEPMSLKEIALKIRRTQPTVTVLINKLEKNGYVIRTDNPLDKRSNHIKLSSKGRGFQSHFKKISEDINMKLHHSLSEVEAEKLEYLLNKVYKNL